MRPAGFACWLLVAVSLGLPREAPAAAGPKFAQARISLCGEPAPPPSSSVCGLSVVALDAGPQVALMARPTGFVASVRKGEEVVVTVAVQGVTQPFRITAETTLVHGAEATVSLSIGGQGKRQTIRPGATVRLEAAAGGSANALTVNLRTAAAGDEAAVRWRRLRLLMGGRWFDVPISPAARKPSAGPPPILAALRQPIEQALIEWDWRMQDGIGTQREPSTYAAAIERTLRRGDDVIADLRARGLALADEAGRWEKLRGEWRRLSRAQATDASAWEGLWRRVHRLRRRIALANPLAKVGPLLFAKQVPGAFSHQLTQYYGRYARPGGGIFVLDEPGVSMRCRCLTAGKLPEGSYQHPEVSYEANRVLFSYCRADTTPRNMIQGHHGRYYHLYEMSADGSRLRQLTQGRFDDLAPRYLPNGKIVFISTRRGGWHRCGNPGCENHTLAIANADGSHPRPLSWHETHEWDPSVLDDGRVIYTRWDYVDRHAVYYEQVWVVRPDGSAPAAFYGNNTFSPVGIWEARQVPGSKRVIATAGAHHAMTAGSIVLLDVAKGVDGPDPITRLTPDAVFPESENRLLPHWRSISPPNPPSPPEEKRWPGHCYRSPYALSERHFLAAYSFDPLIGEPKGNKANMFGIYLVDAFGNKELLYRDLNIASLWPIPLRPRRRPPIVTSVADEAAPAEGTFFLQDVYESQPRVPRGTVKRLRIVQVLPKSTPGINNPPVGVPNASPGKQVLGTVPVEPDGSAYFRAPANTPLSLQALDERGQAVQVMRSLTYLQPGENAACIGCHEPRSAAPPALRVARALSRPPSPIEAAPDGSKPLSYPILVQPVLDKHCVRCHSREKPEGKVVLTGEPQGRYTASYNALAPRVSYSAWGRPGGDFRRANSEPISLPGYFGARGSAVTRFLEKGHYKVELTAAEMNRLVTWMDANALFYGTFDPADQARQRRGERIEGPKLQ